MEFVLLLGFLFLVSIVFDFIGRLFSNSDGSKSERFSQKNENTITNRTGSIEKVIEPKKRTTVQRSAFVLDEFLAGDISQRKQRYEREYKNKIIVDAIEKRKKRDVIVKELGNYGVVSLWHMTHWKNVEAILNKGLLSHTLAHQNINLVDISNHDVQHLRMRKEPIYGRKLHDYAPTYINVKNPMLYVKKDIQNQLCLIEISLNALCEGNYVFSDGNAASKDTAFYGDIDSLWELPWDVLDASYWNDFQDGKRKRCAEFLIYPKIDASHIKRIHCYSKNTREKILSSKVDVVVSKNLFF